MPRILDATVGLLDNKLTKNALADFDVLPYTIAVNLGISKGDGMSYRNQFSLMVCIGGLMLFGVSGCDTLSKAGVPGLESYVKRDPEELKFETAKREEFTLHHDHKALYWLMANRIETGMRLSEVEQILGESGEDVSDQSYGTKDGIHQTTDSAYSWGPDSEGRSVVLFFREGHLANFNRKDYVKQ